MEKYGTYLVFKNKKTGEIKRLPVKDEGQEELMKLAHKDDWEELDYDPEDKLEDKH